LGYILALAGKFLHPLVQGIGYVNITGRGGAEAIKGIVYGNTAQQVKLTIAGAVFAKGEEIASGRGLAKFYNAVIAGISHIHAAVGGTATPRGLLSGPFAPIVVASIVETYSWLLLNFWMRLLSLSAT